MWNLDLDEFEQLNKKDKADNLPFYDTPEYKEAHVVDLWISKNFLVSGWSDIQFRLTGGMKEYPLLKLDNNSLYIRYYKKTISDSIIKYAHTLAKESDLACEVVNGKSGVEIVYHGSSIN